MKRLIQKILPPGPWKIPVILLMGIFSGLFFYLLYISNAPSYLSDSPKTCVNCHIMAPQYATWAHSSHREVAHCNDCHVPHNNLFNHFYFKAKDGLRHATVFTARKEPQVIFIKEDGREVVHQNCIRCHDNTFYHHQLAMDGKFEEYHQNQTDRLCWDCHRETPHGRIKGLASAPNARVPLPDSPVPEWLRKALRKKPNP